MYNRISELDKDRISNYISRMCCNSRISLKELLTPWAEAKSEYLGNLFGNDLIIKKEISFKEGYEEIYERYKNIIIPDARCERFLAAIRHIYNNSNNYYEHWMVQYAVGEAALINNEITEYLEYGNKRKITLPDGTIFTVTRGMKPMKLITKLANAFKIGITPDENGISDLEYFRRKHSLLFNNKELKGELCVSIHPLDYMTMSDNDCDWQTCMSWEHEGEYKQGTVEMMNSPNVVVAYLTASEPYRFNVWGDANRDDFAWNNKKWRCLFIVDKDFIMSVKQYPYYNKSLVCAAAEKIAEVSGWGECKAEEYDFGKRRWNDVLELSTGQQVFFDFHTGAMYNDFGSDDHFVIVNPKVERCVKEDYWYSGVSECMCCGETNEENIGRDTGPEYLLCDMCEPRSRCEECGYIICNHDNDGWTTEDGYYLCEECFDSHTEQSDLTECYWYGALNTLYLSTSNEGFGKGSDAIIRFAYAETGYYEWTQCFKCKEPAPHPDYYGSYYVTPEQCTDEGLRLFEIEDEDDLKDYMGSNENN